VSDSDATEANPAGIGIEFQYRDETERQRIDALVRKLMVQELGSKLVKRLLDND